MKTLLTYSSKTNNTAKVADAIYEKMSEATYKKITDLKEEIGRASCRERV